MPSTGLKKELGVYVQLLYFPLSESLPYFLSNNYISDLKIQPRIIYNSPISTVSLIAFKYFKKTKIKIRYFLIGTKDDNTKTCVRKNFCSSHNIKGSYNHPESKNLKHLLVIFFIV